MGAHWAADCVMQRLNILGSIEYNYTFFQIKFIAAPNWWTGIYICNIYEVYSSTDPINSAQYVSRAEYWMVAKEKKTLQRCLYNAVSWAVTLTPQETLMWRIFTGKEYYYIIRVVPRVLPLGYCQLERNNTLFLCRHEDTSSFRLFSVERSGWRIIMNFYNRHKLHLLLALLYGLALAKMFHEMVWLMLLSFKVQMCLLSSAVSRVCVTEWRCVVSVPPHQAEGTSEPWR